jgi:hypothetical protein
MKDALDFQALGVNEAVEMLETVALHVHDMRGVEDSIDDALSQGYKRQFADWGGWLVDTGRLRASLTENASPDALREAHLDAVEFGSTTPYARFHASALLNVTPRVERDVAETVADYYVRDADTSLSAFHDRASA